jgi:hypothetical protein
MRTRRSIMYVCVHHGFHMKSYDHAVIIHARLVLSIEQGCWLALLFNNHPTSTLYILIDRLMRTRAQHLTNIRRPHKTNLFIMSCSTFSLCTRYVATSINTGQIKGKLILLSLIHSVQLEDNFIYVSQK